jgi:hypothetical protein
MLFQINGFSISTLNKASNDKIITVDIVANHLTPDSDDELVLKEAFNKETVKNFLDIGVVEFWHESKNPILTKEEKNSNLLGKPIAFRWQDGKPVVTAQLTKSHPIVQTMLPHLEAEQPVYSASIGGSKMVLEVADSLGKKHKVIPKIKWDHLAIAPANSVINREPGMNVRLLQKANDILCEFDDLNIFSRNSSIIEHEEVLTKALMAPSNVSDMYNGSSGGVITKQDIEKKPVKLLFDENEGLDLIHTIIGIKNKKIPLRKAEYLKHFEKKNKKEFGNKSFMLIDKFIKMNRSIN